MDKEKNNLDIEYWGVLSSNKKTPPWFIYQGKNIKKYPVQVGAEFNHIIDYIIRNLRLQGHTAKTCFSHNAIPSKQSFYQYKKSKVIVCDQVLGRPTHDFIKYRRRNGQPYYHVDHAYFWRGYGRITKNEIDPFGHEWYRISKNNHAQHTLLDVDDDRWKKYFYDHFFGYGKEYKRRGSKILFCRSSKHVLSICDHESDWADQTLKILKDNTDREIVIREKPGRSSQTTNVSRSTENTLVQDLEDCWALVTHSSAAAITAQLMGIPTFCVKQSPTSPVSCHDFSLIETPFYPDDNLRINWLNSLAYSQYTRLEFEDGTVSKNLPIFDNIL